MIENCRVDDCQKRILVAAIEDAIETLESMDLHVDNPLYQRLLDALVAVGGSKQP